MKVAIIGAGNIGGTLARRLAAAGHEVTLGVRDATSAAVVELVRATGARAASPDVAVRDADAVVLAVPGGAAADVVAALGEALDGKVVVDAANNMRAPVANARAAVAAAAPRARYVRAFNTLGWESLADPDYGGVTADGLYAADDDADAPARELIESVGLHPVRVGAADQTDVVDGALRLWFALVFGQARGRGVAFKVLTR